MKNNSFGLEQQMEISFERAWEASPSRPRRQTRHQRAAWWFSQTDEEEAQAVAGARRPVLKERV